MNLDNCRCGATPEVEIAPLTEKSNGVFIECMQCGRTVASHDAEESLRIWNTAMDNDLIDSAGLKNDLREKLEEETGYWEQGWNDALRWIAEKIRIGAYDYERVE